MSGLDDLLWEAEQEESFERRILMRIEARSLMRTSRSELCKAGKHELCKGVFQSTDRDPVAHRARGVLRCDCECGHGSTPE